VPVTAVVHLLQWRLDRPMPEAERGRLWASLTVEERERALRFRFAADRRDYIAGRGRLREILGRAVGTPAAAVPLQTLEQGKPVLDPAMGGSLRFNLSHSEGLALLALVDGCDVGVDVEALRPGFAADSIAERFFAPEEVGVLRSLPLEEQEAAFFRCWTRKEAYLKGKGGGLSIPLDEFGVSLSARPEGSALLWSRVPDGDERQWSVVDVSSWCPGHHAAVAVRAVDVEIVRHHCASLTGGDASTEDQSAP
jgi:4'-phosphopantetheinyl transferase